MALSVGNILDTGCEKHRIQCDFLHLFNPFKPDLHPISSIYILSILMLFLHLFNPLKPDFHRFSKSQQVNESTGQRVIGYRGE